MANEHVLMTQKTYPISMTCANGTGIEKGALLSLADLDTAATSTTTAEALAGVAYTEKVASDGNTSIAVLSGPGDELKAYASGSIAVGDPLMAANTTSFPNYLMAATPGLSGSHTIGIAKETAADGETFKYVLQMGVAA